jgi:site-specific DNA recombinase
MISNCEVVLLKTSRMNQKNWKAAIYARVSTIDKQDYDRQVNELMKLAVNMDGYNESEIGVFADKITGRSTLEERADLSRLVNLVESGESNIERIYVSEISRLGRDSDNVRAILGRIHKKKVPIYIKNIGNATLNDDGEPNVYASILIAILIEFAKAELETIREHVISGLYDKAKSGGALGTAWRPYGYTSDEDNKLVVAPEEAEVVRSIFELYASGLGTKAIAKKLNSDGIKTKANKTHEGRTINFRNLPLSGDAVRWADSVVREMLMNPIYKGQRRYKGEIFSAPAIVSESLWDKCDQIRKTKTHRNFETKYTYLLKDKMKCGVCGRNYYGRYKPVKGGDEVYICSSRLTGKSCGNKGVNISLIESALLDQLSKASDETWQTFYRANKQEIAKWEDRLEQIKTERQSTITEEESIKKSTSKLTELYLDNRVERLYFDEKHDELCNRLKTVLEKSRTLVKKQAEVERALEDTVNVPAKVEIEKIAGNREQLKSIIDSLISEMWIRCDGREALLRIRVKLDGHAILTNELGFVLNLGGLRKKPKKYSYKAVSLDYYVPNYGDPQHYVEDGDELIYLEEEVQSGEAIQGESNDEWWNRLQLLGDKESIQTHWEIIRGNSFQEEWIEIERVIKIE